jgi:hypothetical protein
MQKYYTGRLIHLHKCGVGANPSAFPSGCELYPAKEVDAELTRLRERVAELEESLDEVIEERDSAEDAIQETHIALGGDGEWSGKLPPEAAPNSGDLKLDTPSVAVLIVCRERLLMAALRWLLEDISEYGVRRLTEMAPEDIAPLIAEAMEK